MNLEDKVGSALLSAIAFSEHTDDKTILDLAIQAARIAMVEMPDAYLSDPVKCAAAPASHRRLKLST